MKLFPLALLGLLLPVAAMAAAPEPITRIGVLTDLSGSMAEAAGKGSIEAAEMAVEDATRGNEDHAVTIVTADYQSRGDLAQHISEDWIMKQNVDMVVDVPNTVIASRLQELFRQQGKILLSSSSRKPDDTSNCGGNGIFWLTDRDTLSANLIKSLVSTGKQRWFILGGDTVYATSLANTVKALIQSSGGQIAGEAYMGPRFTGLSTVLEQIKPGQVDVVYLALERPDILFLFKHWPVEAKALPPLALSTLHLSDLSDMKDMPLPSFYMMSSFYWNQDAQTRAFSDRFSARNHGAPPSAIQAAVYSAVYHYLRSVSATAQKGSDLVLTSMRNQPLQDNFFHNAKINSNGTISHRLYMLLSKKQEERESPFDFFQVVKSLPPNELVSPPATPCPAASAN